MQQTMMGERAGESALSARFQMYAYAWEHLPARNYVADTRATYAAETRLFLL